MDLEHVAKDVSRTVGKKSILDLVRGHTGFTNLYSAYRNSVAIWVDDNFKALLPMYKAALLSRSHKDRIALIKKIEALPGIPKAGTSQAELPPENFLTPAFFMLDPDIRFPLINGRESIQRLLRALNVSDAGLESQYKALVRLYNSDGIDDAADLDQIPYDDNFSDYLAIGGVAAKKVLLTSKRISSTRVLPLKDEADVEAIRQASTTKQRRIHNGLTNKLIEALSDYTLLEGGSPDCMFDILVKNYNHDGSDLMIEAKSSIETPHVRMAMGQLLEYWHELKGEEEPHHLAVLLPARPAENIIAFLEWMDIGLMWFEREELKVIGVWLEHLGNKS